jgi:outer membrane lipoprotein-sorting protein
MRHLLALAAVVLPALASAAEPKAVVELAIKAHGGKDALAKAVIGSQKMSGTMTQLNTEVEFAGEVQYALPDKYKMTLTLTLPGNKLVATQTVNGDKVKTVIDGKAQELTAPQKGELRQTTANQEISLLVALLDEKKYTLKAAPDAKVADTDAAVVVVSGKGITDVTLYFEKKTGQLVRMTREAVGPDDKPVAEETTLSDFKKFGDVLLPTKLVVTRGGKKFMTMTLSDAKWLDKIDDKTFAVDQ